MNTEVSTKRTLDYTSLAYICTRRSISGLRGWAARRPSGVSSPWGISPRGPRRTGRERLRSPGSHHLAENKRLCLISGFLPLRVDPPMTPNDATEAQPLRSTRITRSHRYYELLRPCALHRYAGSYGVIHLSVSLHISTTGSHVPRRSPEPRHATSTPDTTQPVDRLPLDLSRTTEQDPVLMSSTAVAFDASAVVRLRSSHDSPHDASFDAFSLTLTTPTLNRSRSGLFEASPAGLRRAHLHLLRSYDTSKTSCLIPCLVAHVLLQGLGSRARIRWVDLVTRPLRTPCGSAASDRPRRPSPSTAPVPCGAHASSRYRGRSATPW